MSYLLDLRVGDCREILPTLAAGSAHCCVTSPPYWGLRDYGVPGQLGLEPTPEAYVEAIVAVFQEVRRVLRDDGTLWLNLGDSYAGSWGAQSREHAGKHAPNVSVLSANQVKAAQIRQAGTGSLARTPGLKPKDLVGIPWRVAFALQADGWWLRSDIIWAKPNPMPESVTDRPTKAHEYLFLLSKSERYYYDAQAISWPSSDRLPGNAHPDKHTTAALEGDPKLRTKTGMWNLQQRWQENGPPPTVNARTVWTVASSPFSGAHFATFPPALIEPCIKAGSPAGGLVLDPFAGAGTTGLVANRLGRNSIGIELNPEYRQIARDRVVDDAPLLVREVAS